MMIKPYGRKAGQRRLPLKMLKILFLAGSLFYLAGAQSQDPATLSPARDNTSFPEYPPKENWMNLSFTQKLQKRKQSAEEEKRRQTQYWPDYTACHDMEEQPIHLEDLASNTEAGFCLSCKKASPVSAIKKPIQKTLKRAFKEKLRKRVVGLLESRIFKIRILKACFKKDIGFLKKKSAFSQVDFSLLKRMCEKKVRELKPMIKNRWRDMRVSLSLASPRLKTSRFLPHEPSSYMNSSLSHIGSSPFVSLPDLSPSEKELAQKRYKENVLKALNKNYSQSNIDHSFYWREMRQLTRSEKKKYKVAEQELMAESESRYFELIYNLPVLGFLEKEPTQDKTITQAYEKKEQQLKKILDTAKDPSADLEWLISFKPLVEDLLTEDKGDRESSPYCLVAEKARIQAEKSQKRKEDMIFFGMLAALAPCFMPLSFGVCIAGELAISSLELHFLDKANKRSFNRVLLGKEFEKISELRERQKELKMAKAFLPLLLLELGGIRGAARGVVKKSKKSKQKSKRP